MLSRCPAQVSPAEPITSFTKASAYRMAGAFFRHHMQRRRAPPTSARHHPCLFQSMRIVCYPRRALISVAPSSLLCHRYVLCLGDSVTDIDAAQEVPYDEILSVGFMNSRVGDPRLLLAALSPSLVCLSPPRALNLLRVFRPYFPH